MTVRDIQALVASADPAAKHYVNTKDGTDYTVWMEYQRIGLPGDDVHGDGWKFEVDRYTKTEYDEVAEEIERVLTEHDGVAFTYMVEYEQDSRYIRHIFDCEGC